MPAWSLQGYHRDYSCPKNSSPYDVRQFYNPRDLRRLKKEKKKSSASIKAIQEKKDLVRFFCLRLLGSLESRENTYRVVIPYFKFRIYDLKGKHKIGSNFLTMCRQD